MDTPTKNTEGQAPRSGAMKAGVAGAVLGVGALLGSFMVLGSGAGAQSSSDSATSNDGSTSTIAIEADEAKDVDGFITVLDDPALDSFFACLDQAWEDAFGDKDESQISEADFQAAEDAIEAAEESCESQLPEGVDLDAMWDDLEDSFEAEFDDFDLEDIPEVVVETEDGINLLDLGDGDGTITITKVGDDISIATEGDVTSEVIDWAAIEAGFDDYEDGDLDEMDEDMDLDEMDLDDEEEPATTN